VLNQSGAAGIFCVPEFRSPMAQFLAEVRPDVPALREVVYFTEWDGFLGTAPARAALPDVSPDDIAQIQYTSGTTGFPKGAGRLTGARRVGAPGRGPAGRPLQHRVRHHRVLPAGHPGQAG